MDPALRRAWTEIVTADDYEKHMAAIGQAQAAAELTRELIASSALSTGTRIVIAGAGTGQMFDFLDPAIFRPYELECTDLNASYLERLRARLQTHGLKARVFQDDIERTGIVARPGMLLATLLLEHIEWRCGVEAFASLAPAECGIIIQENPPGMSSAVTPGRVLPESLARAMETAHAVLVDRVSLIAEFGRHGYECAFTASRQVADGKQLTALRLIRRGEELPAR